MKTKFDKGSFLLVPNKQIIRGRPAEMQSIYFWLCEHADEKMTCFPSRKTIAEEAGCGLDSVDKYIPELISLGLLIKENRVKEDTKEKLSNLYHILIVEGVAVKSTLPSSEINPTPSSEKPAVTHPILNSPNLTLSAISENRGEDTQIQRRPLEVGDSMTPRDYYANHYSPRGSQRKTDAPSAQIVAVLDLFKPVNPAYLSMRLMMLQREAVDRLLKIMKYEALKELVSFIAEKKSERFMPVITTPVALENKMGDLAVFYQKEKNKSPAFI